MPSNPAMPAEKKSKRSFSWPLIVVALLGGHAALIIGAATLAVGGSGRGVVPDYYAQAVDFDAHKADLAASAKLGWTLTLTPGSLIDDQGQRLVSATLVDAQGQPIENASIQLRLIRLVDGQAVQTTLTQNTDRPGTYQGVGDLPAAGWYQADLLAERDGVRFVQRQEIQAFGGTRPFSKESAP